MLELKHSEAQQKYKGSPELKAKLLPGDMKAISTVLGLDYTKVINVIEGRYYGDPEIVECAERLAALYDTVELKQKVTEILDSYGTINQ